ncbi:hypothetical protein [Burkholderia sp. BE17]|uniref:hypothetical protein n=1 Tax=Burkholderia sp. BE17 TaxID=2656644 RepID=UPI00128D1EE4|nr:hypothetical protein [Burkholderia sp. BE17]MPV66360.1 hypothetical protein [Burkholderia sp. BE17]
MNATATAASLPVEFEATDSSRAYAASRDGRAAYAGRQNEKGLRRETQALEFFGGGTSLELMDVFLSLQAGDS